MLHSSLPSIHAGWKALRRSGALQSDSRMTQGAHKAQLLQGSAQGSSFWEQFLGNALASTGSCPLQAGRAPAQFPAFRRGLEHRRDAGRAESRGFPCKGPLSPSFPLCSSPLEKERAAGRSLEIDGI